MLLVADAIERNDWKWPSDWYDKYPILKSVQVPVLDELVKDTIKKVDNYGIQMVFSSKKVWKDLYVNVQEKLLTQDRVLKWKPNEILECAMCGKCSDSYEHLFFQCTYSAKEWGKLQPMINRKAPELEGQC
nr:hypothetical protein [Tanacetum cinerariifolium]